MKVLKIISKILFIALLAVLASCANEPKERDYEKELSDFITAHEKIISPLQQRIQMAEFNAAVTGRDEDYNIAAQANIELTAIYSNVEEFKLLSEIKESGKVANPLLARQLDILYNEYKFHQVEKQKMVEMIELATKMEKEIARFRVIVNNKELTMNEVNEILTTSKNTQEVKNVWEASKKMGNLVAEDFVKLVKMRNEASKSLGFNNYFEMRLILSGQDPKALAGIYDEFELITAGPYSELKNEIDTYLANFYKITKEELMPWHYQDLFFQNAPLMFEADLDAFYKEKDLVMAAEKYYAGIGLDISDILNQSDLFPAKDKSEMAITHDVNRNGDVRIIASIGNSEASMNQLLYECGFAVYLKYINKDLPYFLRTSPHMFMNDAIAVLFSRFSSNPDWIAQIMETEKVISDAEQSNNKKNQRMQKFVFARWAQVMYRFERALYENPDQDLNKLWWDLVEKYQLIKRPTEINSAYWATKAHLISQPCTYHNYILGELFASQVYMYIKQNVAKGENDCSELCIGNTDVGKYLIDNIFSKGASLTWQELIKSATGEELNADYYKMQYINVEN